MKKETQLNMRISKELHEEIKKEAIRRSVQTNELVTASEVAREILEKKLLKNGK